VPELHLVGAPIPDDPQSPGQWQPIPPAVQYGIDYAFTHRVGREPVRWRHNSTITVRLVETGAQGNDHVLASVIDELRALTKLDLVTGAPVPGDLIPSAVPDQEIHVGYLTASKLTGTPPRPANQAGLGGATLCDSGCCYINGFAIVNADLAADATSERALAILRHELAHSIGLGHATRSSLLMHHQIAASTIQYGRGDRHGLAVLGPRPSSASVVGCGPPPIRRAARRPAASLHPEASMWTSPRQLDWCLVSPAPVE
jgi:hypothetical protein